MTLLGHACKSTSAMVALSANLLSASLAACAGMRESVLTYFTLVPIAGGVVIASGGEPLFNLFGFMACIIATCCRALKSVVQVSNCQHTLRGSIASPASGQHPACSSMLSV
jgi:hypothetical protein